MQGELFFVVLGAAFVAVLSKWFSSPAFKGARGERAVHRLLQKSLLSSEYTVLRDVTLPAGDGTTQIDHIVISRFGIFVIETKNLSGWIFGGERDSHWTQSLGHSRFEFPNPLRQNRAHIEALQELLGLHSSRFHSLVVFTGKAEFRNSLPPHVMRTKRLVPYIEVNSTQFLEPEAVQRAVEVIEANHLEPGPATDVLPVESLRARHGPKAGVPKTAHPGPRFPARVPGRALAGFASVALLLVAGNALVQTLIGPTVDGDHHPPAFPEPPSAASLQCAYDSSTDRCACYDAEGARIRLEFDECKVRAAMSMGHDG